MTIVLKRLQGLFDVNIRDGSNNNQHFSLDSHSYFMRDSVAIKARVAPAMLVIEQESSLILEYATLRDLLEKTLKSDPVDDVKAIILVKEALKLSTLLHQIYVKHCNDRPALRRSKLKSHQNKYIAWLNYKAPEWLKLIDITTDKDGPIIADLPLTTEVLSTTDLVNPYRLGLLRVRRLMLLLIPFIHDAHYTRLILGADIFLAPIIIYFGLCFFLPRLIYNLVTMMLHVIEHEGMSDDEKSLGSFTRFCIQWDRMWPNLTNDVAWATNGILMCFVLTGTWLPFGIYLSVSMQFYDAVLASARAYLELSRLNNLEKHYQAASDNDVNNIVLRDYLLALQNNINHTEKWLVYLSLSNFFILLLGISLALPLIIAVNPLLPIIGAILAVVITVINAKARAQLTARAPNALDDNLLTPPIINEDSLINNMAEEEHQAEVIDTDIPIITTPETRLRKRSSSLSLFKSNSIDSFKRNFSESRLDLQASPTTVSQSFSIDCLHKIGINSRSPSIVC